MAVCRKAAGLRANQLAERSGRRTCNLPFRTKHRGALEQPREQRGYQRLLGLEMKEDETGTQPRLARHVSNPQSTEALTNGDTKGGIENLLSPCDFWCFPSGHNR